ncbi:MAG: hypothetical protein ACI9N9_001921 [Enterobacterales bacterium]|jgi:hypothetical protein
MHRLAIGCLCLILSNTLFADELTVPVGQQGDLSKVRPASGMSTEVVEEKFGAPESINDAIGDPPITIWRYNSYSVYFEYNQVIHTVLHKADA